MVPTKRQQKLADRKIKVAEDNEKARAAIAAEKLEKARVAAEKAAEAEAVMEVDA